MLISNPPFRLAALLGPIIPLFLLISDNPHASADRIILRDLTLLDEVNVESFDVSGVRLGDGTLLSWDRIELARLDDERQDEFDRQLSALGEPLFRLRRRLINGDHDEVLEIAERLAATYADERCESALVVALALMRGRLHAGNRPAALPAYLHVLDSARQLDDARLTALQRELDGLSINTETGLCSQFMPIWFDADGALEVLPEVSNALAAMQDPPPTGCFVYGATLALAAGESEQAANWLARIEPGNLEIDEWKLIAQLQQAVSTGDAVTVTEIEGKVDNLLPRNRAVALYWLGTAKYQEDEPRRRQEAILTWLRLPAEYGEYSELAAAGLYYAQHALGEMENDAGQRTLIRELVSRYPRSFFAQRIRAARSIGNGL